MEKTIKIGFDEAQKAVTASIQITTTGEELDNTALLQEAKALFEEAYQYSHAMTVKKTIGGN